jgi:UDP-N-acetylmuramoyl-L-alanyl-D-glutamate--2,6-diaminopimelate ligase
MTVAAAEAGFDVAALMARLGVVPRRITADSRDVHPGDAFAAYPGAVADGRAFIGDALGRGAGAVLWEPAGFRWNDAWQVPEQPVPRLRERLSAIAAFVFGHPSQALWTIGVTGTNGKTSCTHWIAQCLAACGRRAGVLGTLGNGLVGALVPAPRTTADAAGLQEALADLRRAGADVVAMEVSSHGLDQHRVDAVAFDVALFTNLTRDHLDYHGTMEAYGAAKARLFRWPGLAASVINADDAFGATLAAEAKRHGRSCLTYGTGAADIRATEIVEDAEGIRCVVETPAGRGELAAPVVGSFNLANLLGCLGVLLASGVALPDALAALSRVEPPAGRMQRLGGGDAPLVVVDYAHTPDALQKVLAALRPAVAPGAQLACVFGCGGDRDPGKRPAMGRIAATLADRVVITSDNPRSEDPAAIADAVAAGARAAGAAPWSVELDRGAAIATAVADARHGDVVLIAGKGHETTQEARGERVHFSDAEAAAAALAAWRRR